LRNLFSNVERSLKSITAKAGFKSTYIDTVLTARNLSREMIESEAPVSGACHKGRPHAVTWAPHEKRRSRADSSMTSYKLQVRDHIVQIKGRFVKDKLQAIQYKKHIKSSALGNSWECKIRATQWYYSQSQCFDHNVRTLFSFFATFFSSVAYFICEDYTSFLQKKNCRS
jgi:hypothetical protein